MAIQGLGTPRRKVSMNVQVAAPSTAGVRKEGAAKSKMFQNIAGLAAQLEERRYKAEADSQSDSAKNSLVKEEEQLAKDLNFKYQGTDYKGYEQEYSDGLKGIRATLDKDLDNNAAYDSFDKYYNSYTTKASGLRSADVHIKKAEHFEVKSDKKREDDLVKISNSGNVAMAAELYTNEMAELNNEDLNFRSAKKLAKVKGEMGAYAKTTVNTMLGNVKTAKGVEAIEDLIGGKSKDPKVQDMFSALNSKDRTSLNKEIKTVKKRISGMQTKKLKNIASGITSIMEDGGTVDDSQISQVKEAIKKDPNMDEFVKEAITTKIDVAYQRGIVKDVMSKEPIENWKMTLDPAPKGASIAEKESHFAKQKATTDAYTAGAIAIKTEGAEFLAKHDTNFNKLARNALTSPEDYRSYKEAFDLWTTNIQDSTISPATKEITASFKNITSLVKQGDHSTAADQMQNMIDTLGADTYSLARKSNVSKDILATADAGSNLPRVMRLLSSDVAKTWTKDEKVDIFKKIEDHDQYKAIVGNGTPAETDRARSWAKVIYREVSQQAARGESVDVDQAFHLHSDDNAIVISGNVPMIIPRKDNPEKVNAFVRFSGKQMDNKSYRALDIRNQKGLTEADHIDAIRNGSRWRLNQSNELVLHLWDDDLNMFEEVLDSKNMPVKMSLEQVASSPIMIREFPQIDESQEAPVDLLKGTL